MPWYETSKPEAYEALYWFLVNYHEGPDRWYASFKEATGKPDRDILALFQSNTLPTAFRSSMDAATVLREITALNPGFIVILESELIASN